MVLIRSVVSPHTRCRTKRGFRPFETLPQPSGLMYDIKDGCTMYVEKLPASIVS